MRHSLAVLAVPLLPAALLLMALLPVAAMAHSGVGAEVGAGVGAGAMPLHAGLMHPLLGADHLLTMVAVGVFAAMTGGRAVWAYPASFVGAMLLGGFLGFQGMALPVIEPAILASVLVLGAAIALALRPPFGLACATIGLFGVAHGYAHGLEGPALGGLPYAAGFVISTAGLHALGLGLGFLAGAFGRPAFARGLGGLTAAAGLFLAFA